MESSSLSLAENKTRSRQHIPELDGLRGLAILLVTIYRFGRGIPVSSSGNVLAQTIELGNHGVELFFVLSGFLITGILLDTRGQSHQLRNFFARRSLRIFPLYFAALVVCLWCIPALAGWAELTTIQQAFTPAREQQFYLWFYLTNVQMSLVDSWCFGPLDPFWSLAVEEHFYLLWPLVIVLCRPRALLGVALSLTGLCLVTRTIWLASGGSGTAAEVLTVWRADGLLIGALAAMLIRSNAPHWSNLADVARRLMIPTLVLAIAIDATDRRIWLINSSLWTFAWLCLLVNIMSSKPGGRLREFFAQSWLRNLGQLSYGMYVFQSPLIPLVAALGWTVGVSLPVDLLYVAFMFALTLGVAWCSWHGFEKHCLRLKKYFPQHSTGQPASIQSARLETHWRQPQTST